MDFETWSQPMFNISINRIMAARTNLFDLMGANITADLNDFEISLIFLSEP